MEPARGLVVFAGTMRVPAACVLLSLFASPAAAQCVLSGEAVISRVRIEPRGAPPFDLGLDGYEATVVPLGGGRVRVESATALIWAGTARDGDVRIFLARALPLAGGALRLWPATGVSALRLAARGDPVVDVELAHGVKVRGASVPCDALTLGETDGGTVPDLGPEQGEILPRARSLEVHARPGGPSVRIEAASPSALRLARVESRRGWMRVRRVFPSGASIDGWVRAEAVRVVAPEPLPVEERGSLFGSGCSRGASHTYSGPAVLLAGTALRTSEDGAPWAVASADVEVHVQVSWGAEWGQVDEIRGLRQRDLPECENLLEIAWVPSRALRLPSGGPPP